MLKTQLAFCSTCGAGVLKPPGPIFPNTPLAWMLCPHWYLQCETCRQEKRDTCPYVRSFNPKP